jgi:hypothetical protein
MKINPLLSNEISVSDQLDEAHNENYSKELKVLYDEIMEDLQKADTTGTGKVSEEELLDFLQKKLPPQRQLNIPLFKRFLQNVDQNMEANIDLNEFCKKYIQAHEELKLNFETLKRGFDKEKNLKNGLQEKIQEVKQEQMNKNGISQNAVVQTEIGKITFLAQINTDQIYCMVNLDDNEGERSEIKNIENPVFTKKFVFHIEDKQSSLFYKIFSANNQYIGGVDVPLYMLNVENEEIFSEFELKDDNDQTIGVFKPRIIVVTSYFDWYQKQYDNIDKNIESYQNKINELSETLEELSLPYRSEFEKSQIRLKQGGNIGVNNDQLVNGVEGILKLAFKDKKVKWIVTLKIILYFCILTLLFTTLVKPDFISLFICLLLLILLNTCKTNYIFENFNIFLGGIIAMIAYDLIDYIFLRKFKIDIMSRVEGWARFFGFLGFLGKIALFCAVFVVKVKYQRTGFILE